MAPMTKDKDQDPVWQAAWTWVRHQHAQRGSLDDAARDDEFMQWLAADPLHRKAYDEAARLWLLVGLVPPANDVPPPDDAPDPIAGR
jgi:ferric-dicitrate binding protein FerR (iron transport regulator)